MEGKRGAQEREDGAVVEDGVGEAAKEIDADAEGVDVVHAQVGVEHVGKDEAAEDEGEDRDADACCGGEDPDEEDEGADAEAEHGGYVDFGEHVVLLAVEALFWGGLAVDSLV